MINVHAICREIPQFAIRNRTRYATVTILPEIELSDPIYGYDSNSLWKFRKNETIKSKVVKYQSQSLTWPYFIYKMYDVTVACEKIKKFLSTLKIGNLSLQTWFQYFKQIQTRTPNEIKLHFQIQVRWI